MNARKGWDVFDCGGRFEIQREDCPQKGEPTFRDDAAAVRAVFNLARAGDADAIAALWQCADDDLVHRVLWGMA